MQGSLAGQRDLLKKIRECVVPGDTGDGSRRLPNEDAFQQGKIEAGMLICICISGQYSFKPMICFT